LSGGLERYVVGQRGRGHGAGCGCRLCGSCRSRSFHVSTPAANVGVPTAVELARFDVEINSGYLAYCKLDFVGIVAKAGERHLAGELAFGVLQHIFSLFPCVAALGDTGYLGQGSNDCSFNFHYIIVFIVLAGARRFRRVQSTKLR